MPTSGADHQRGTGDGLVMTGDGGVGDRRGAESVAMW